MINHPNRSKKPVTKITRAVAKKVLAVVDAGLVSGVGDPEPGKMCVEAAVCYAMGLPHGDKKRAVARDKSLAAFCEEVVQVLIAMKAPGCRFLDLAPLEVAA